MEKEEEEKEQEEHILLKILRVIILLFFLGLWLGSLVFHAKINLSEIMVWIVVIPQILLFLYLWSGLMEALKYISPLTEIVYPVLRWGRNFFRWVFKPFNDSL